MPDPLNRIISTHGVFKQPSVVFFHQWHITFHGRIAGQQADSFSCLTVIAEAVADCDDFLKADLQLFPGADSAFHSSKSDGATDKKISIVKSLTHYTPLFGVMFCLPTRRDKATDRAHLSIHISQLRRISDRFGSVQTRDHAVEHRQGIWVSHQ